MGARPCAVRTLPNWDYPISSSDLQWSAAGRDRVKDNHASASQALHRRTPVRDRANNGADVRDASPDREAAFARRNTFTTSAVGAVREILILPDLVPHRAERSLPVTEDLETARWGGVRAGRARRRARDKTVSPRRDALERLLRVHVRSTQQGLLERRASSCGQLQDIPITRFLRHHRAFALSKLAIRHGSILAAPSQTFRPTRRASSLPARAIVQPIVFYRRGSEKGSAIINRAYTCEGSDAAST